MNNKFKKKKKGKYFFNNNNYMNEKIRLVCDCVWVLFLLSFFFI